MDDEDALMRLIGQLLGQVVGQVGCDQPSNMKSKGVPIAIQSDRSGTVEDSSPHIESYLKSGEEFQMANKDEVVIPVPSCEVVFRYPLAQEVRFVCHSPWPAAFNYEDLSSYPDEVKAAIKTFLLVQKRQLIFPQEIIRQIFPQEIIRQIIAWTCTSNGWRQPYGGGITRVTLVDFICHTYQEIYEEETRTASHPVPTIEERLARGGLMNRPGR